METYELPPKARAKISNFMANMADLECKLIVYVQGVAAGLGIQVPVKLDRENMKLVEVDENK